MSMNIILLLQVEFKKYIFYENIAMHAGHTVEYRYELLKKNAK